MALPLRNSFETALADETAITTGNSDDGSAGNAFDTVTLGGGTIVFDTAQFAHGDLSARLISAGSPAAMYFGWESASVGTVTEIWGRAYIYRTAHPSGNQWPIYFADSAAARAGIIYWGNDGSFFVFNSSLGTSDQGEDDWQLNVWNRIEWHLVSSTTVGSLEAKLYEGDSTTVRATASISNTNTLANLQRVYFGDVSAGTATSTTWFDDVVVNAGGYPGPAPSGAYATEVVADSPAAYYRMQEASGLIQDSSGNANHASASGGTATYQQTSPVVSDASAKAISFSGDDYFSIPDHATLTWATRSRSKCGCAGHARLPSM